jgi:hypothetical protein
VARSWKGEFGSDPSEGDLVDLARLFRIRRFGADTASTDWREATSLVGSRLYAGADQGERRPQRCLKSSGSLFAAELLRIEMAWRARFDLPVIPISGRPGSTGRSMRFAATRTTNASGSLATRD